VVHHLLSGCNIALSDTVEDWGLSVSVEMVWVRAFLHQHVNHTAVAFAHRVVDWQLLKTVFACSLNTFFDEKLDQLNGAFLIFNSTSIKQGRLSELKVIIKIGNIQANLINHRNNFVDLSFFHSFKELLV
jgi:hypothetical protein